MSEATPTPRPRVVLVDGVPMSALVASVPEPRAVIVAVHGGATSAAYFDCPGHPQLSLLRAAAAQGYTAIALDRPGYGASAYYHEDMADTDRRVGFAMGAVDKILGESARGAGLFLMAHSAGCELGLRMAVDERATDVLGVELAGTGLRYGAEAKAVISQATATSRPAGLRDLLWEPTDLYPPEVLTGGLSAPGAPYEAEVTANWPRRDFADVAARVDVPVEFSVADHERVWETTPEAIDAIAALFTSSPRVVVNEMPDSGHNLSAGWSADAYHRASAVVRRGMCCRAEELRYCTGGGLMRVGFIGLGSQGGPMARRIVEGGFDLTLWARRPATLEPFADTAAKTAGSPAELAAASDLVCLCVVGDDDIREVLNGDSGVLAGLAPGGIVAIHSTVHPDTCSEIAKSAAEQGVSVIDAPVSGGGQAAEEGELLVMVGGDPEVVERCRPVFATYADPIVHLGPLGSGQVTKILNNLLFTANLGSAISTLELGESLGLDRIRLSEVLTAGSATSKALGSIAAFGGTLDQLATIAGALLQKDVRHAARIAESASVPTGVAFDAADAALRSMDYPR